MHTEYAEDKELIELAAKAAGITLVSKLMPNPDGTETLEFFQLFDNGRIGTWNPLKDDGDALRLAVKLDIDLSFYSDREAKVYANTKHLLGYSSDGYGSWQDHEYQKELYDDSDPYAATRKAITRAAAEIGRIKQ